MCQPDPGKHTEGCRNEGENKDFAKWGWNSSYSCDAERKVKTGMLYFHYWGVTLGMLSPEREREREKNNMLTFF